MGAGPAAILAADSVAAAGLAPVVACAGGFVSAGTFVAHAPAVSARPTLDANRSHRRRLTTSGQPVWCLEGIPFTVSTIRTYPLRKGRLRASNVIKVSLAFMPGES
jgi:hypothetical protein